jgi:hypothetical protein
MKQILLIIISLAIPLILILFSINQILIMAYGHGMSL